MSGPLVATLASLRPEKKRIIIFNYSSLSTWPRSAVSSAGHHAVGRGIGLLCDCHIRKKEGMTLSQACPKSTICNLPCLCIWNLTKRVIVVHDVGFRFGVGFRYVCPYPSTMAALALISSFEAKT